ncbi:MAG: low affinity iron permease family protein [Chloroflexi bacterium]|nr:low affinity iron permease family protein [Chloroflexota bacterium]
MNELFQGLAQRTARAAGSSWAFVFAAGIVLGWAISGPIFHFSDTWQLIINTGTTIVTFLMVFLIQNSQNRDTQAIHLKLDELLRAVQGAREDRFIDLEDATEQQLKRVRQEIERDAHAAEMLSFEDRSSRPRSG